MKAVKRITSYVHPPIQTSAQQPDTAPGPYYVSAKDGDRFWLMSGPYALHAEALAMVGKVRAVCNEHEARSVWYAFGTVRMKPDFAEPGNLQKCGFGLDCERLQLQAS